MTDERMDALIRRLDVTSDPDPEFVRSTYLALRPRARAARVSDASWIGRLVRDLRLLTLSAASSQRSPWRPQFRSTTSTPVLRPAWLKGLVAAMVIGVIAVGAAMFVTRPDQPAVGGPSPTPNATFSPSTPASPSAGPSAAVVAPRAAAWTATGNMLQPHARNVATLLLDGRMLVAGGGHETNRPHIPELYDPGTGTWASTGSVGAPRFSYSATLLADGKVLVAGGYGIGGSNQPVASAEVYDPVGGIWSATGSMAAPYDFHTATRLLDGKVLVAGVISAGGQAVPSAELYDPASGSWSATGAMATARAYHTATLLPDGKVLVAGGSPDGGQTGTPSSELYDPISGTWVAAGNMITPRQGHTATLLPDGRVLVAGGNTAGLDLTASAELYDPQSGAWSVTQDMVAPRNVHTATLLRDGRVLVAGGWGSANTSLASAELYDPASGTWSATESMVASRGNHTAMLLPDGRVLVAGGYGGLGIGAVPLASAELYDPGSGK